MKYRQKSRNFPANLPAAKLKKEKYEIWPSFAKHESNIKRIIHNNQIVKETWLNVKWEYIYKRTSCACSHL